MSKHAKNNLDALTVNIELTLISIIQGVALYFLTESSRGLIVDLDWAFWPYILTGLLTIFNFWARSILHTLTVIRWPLDFTHTFFYFSVVFLEAVAFTQIHHPVRWFSLYASLAVVVLIMFLIDLRMIRRHRDTPTPSSERLLDVVEHEQWQNIFWLTPGFILFNLVCGYLILRFPNLFLEKGWHTLLGSLQLLGSLCYLAFSIQFFRRLSPLILAHRAEQLPAA